MTTTKHCAGCRNDYYNQPGNSTAGKCWSLPSAKMVWALDVPVDLRPPYTHLRQTQRPSCYKKDRYVRVKKEALTSDGYWRPSTAERSAKAWKPYP